MPRKPTGRPRGRPPGTGILGEQTRLTVRIPQELYNRLEAFAEGRSYTRGTPQLAVCVREALEQYLAGSYKRQTRNVPDAREDNIRQTINIRHNVKDNTRQTEKSPEARSPKPEASGDENRQTIIAPAAREKPTEAQSVNISQPINEPAAHGPRRAEARDNTRQTENTALGYDTSKFYLGELCGKGHAYAGTRQSLRRLGKRDCLACEQERKRNYKARQRQAQPA